MDTFLKHDSGQAGATRFEAAGLRWRAEAPGGADVVTIVDESPGRLGTRRLTEGAPGAADAEAFGRALARTHAAGAPHLGCHPAGWSGDGFMGRASLPLRDAAPPRPGAGWAPSGGASGSWGDFYAADRVLPYLPAAVANGSVDRDGDRALHALAERLTEGVLDHPQPALVAGPAARLHGDLWGGNVLWAVAGRVRCTLIDPAAHGGHAESDLAQLAVFGAPHLERIVAAYDEVSPFAPGRPERVGLHQLHILLVHAALFGGGYGCRAVAVAALYL
ncbi:fructosamine kinase family protein [Georgenia muralis]|uniref:Fructosamine-3-kinase n=1 Tax=Georgenia muralis TaxID=154117 RepID=A0A3N4ZLN3_9MICO|nr:fructosamine kinase family protein [Georgenia muralis]RPF26602.1 fructosamine-3-kinase [Georgenia muralis]